jgi:DNA invertase Pin-like site-specific DNA recombinase
MSDAKQLYCEYRRVSCQKQGIDGLGMEAQNDAIARYLKSVGATPEQVIGSFQEVESGKRSDRPELDKALALCRKQKALLVIAKLDRLARNASFLLGLRDSGVEFVCCDMPTANRLTIGVLACCAEFEREQISQRTKAALAVVKARGKKLGNPRFMESVAKAREEQTQQSKAFKARLLPVVQEIRETGVNSLRKIALCLNLRGYKSANGGRFAAESVRRVLAA